MEAVPSSAMDFIEELGRKRGCLRKAGIVDIDRASKIFVTELRAGKLGALTLETPEMMVFEKAATIERIAAKEKLKAVKAKTRKVAFKDKNQGKNRKRTR